MKKIVHIVPNVYDRDSWTIAVVDDVLDYLTQCYDELPINTRIYHKNIAATTDVTPGSDHKEIQKFLALEGEFFVVINPTLAPLVIVGIVAAVISLGVSAYMLLTMPKAQKQQQESPNNSLNARQNVARIKGRIPEIFGTVRSYPDLIAETYTYFNTDGVEVERSLLCIGNGFYSILDVKDATTRVNDIAGTSVSIYDPGVDIRTTPIFRSGNTFTDLPLEVSKSRSITGQTLESPENALLDTSAVYFTSAGEIIRRNTNVNFNNLDILAGDSVVLTGAELDFLTETVTSSVTINPQQQIIFTAPDIIDFESYGRIQLGTFNTQIKYWLDSGLGTLEPFLSNKNVAFAGEYNIGSIARTASGSSFIYTVNLQNPENTNTAWLDYIDPTTNNTAKTLNSTITLSDNENDVNLDGTYEVLGIAADKLTLNVANNAAWQEFGVDTQSQNVEITLDKLSTKWIGWHTIYQNQAEQLVFNIHFPQGLYRQNSKGGTSEDYTSFRLDWQYVDQNGVPQGNVQTIEKRIYGKTRAGFGRTERVQLMPAYSGVRFRASRSRKSIANNVSATMNLKDVYLAKTSIISAYEGVTVVQSEAVGSDGLYAIKDRKLNILVQRRLEQDGFGPLVATNRADQALIKLALDAHVGRRKLSEVNITQIKAEINDVIDYFGDSSAADFCATLDDPSLSFEETGNMVASAAFCETARPGGKLRLRFEKPQSNAMLLFNHRNKVPKSEKRSYTLSNDREYDGIEIEYTDPKDDARINYKIPEDGSATNPLKIATTGIRNHKQAKTRAWREWHKLLHKRIDVEFDALDEANLLTRNDMILVADNTRLKTMDGEIEEVNGLNLTLSQPASFDGAASIYVQMPNGTVDIIGCTMGDDEYQVKLNRLPAYEIYNDIDEYIGRYIKTVYQIVPASQKVDLFLLAEASPISQMSQKLTAYNYDPRYYSEDRRFFN